MSQTKRSGTRVRGLRRDSIGVLCRLLSIRELVSRYGGGKSLGTPPLTSQMWRDCAAVPMGFSQSRGCAARLLRIILPNRLYEALHILHDYSGSLYLFGRQPVILRVVERQFQIAARG